MVDFDRLKMEELILHIATRYARDVRYGSTRLTKILFWSEFEYFRQTGAPIAGGRYHKQSNGPMLYGFQDFLKSMESRDLLTIEVRPSGGDRPLRVPLARRAPDLAMFSEDELAVINRTIDERYPFRWWVA